MDLQNSTDENLSFILEQLGKLLDIANQSLLDPKHYDLEKYVYIKEMYEMVEKKGKLSSMETQAFIDELRSVRKTS